MRKRLLLSALVCVIGGVATSVAAAGNPVIAGAGFSAISGKLVLNARATEPIVGSGIPGVAPPSQDLSATGFLRAPAVPVGTGTLDLSGSVTCIGVWLPGFAVAVSGTLNKPLVNSFDGSPVPNFTLLIWRFGSKPWVWLTAGNLPSPAAGTCGSNSSS